MFDCHIHMMKEVQKDVFYHSTEEAGISGGVLLSLPPAAFDGNTCGNPERMDKVLKLAEGKEDFYPFYWIDPLENAARDQVDAAVSLGISGFKIICVDDYPGNEKAMKVYERIAYHNKPVLFHSGILWNRRDSSNFNRPANFECLIGVPGLRFALAHVSWPWHDECLAVFGKYIYSNRHGNMNTMVIDLTPGTPEIYRKEVLTKLYRIGYDVEDHVIWGTDNFSESYDVGWAKNWTRIDEEIFRELKLTEKQIDKIFEKNLLKFIKG